METSFTIQYREIVRHSDIVVLPKTMCIRIKSAIEEKLTTLPHIYGKPLGDSLKGYRKLRVGDYRIVFYIEENVVSISAILHRSKVYDVMKKRV